MKFKIHIFYCFFSSFQPIFLSIQNDKVLVSSNSYKKGIGLKKEQGSKKDVSKTKKIK